MGEDGSGAGRLVGVLLLWPSLGVEGQVLLFEIARMMFP